LIILVARCFLLQGNLYKFATNSILILDHELSSVLQKCFPLLLP